MRGNLRFGKGGRPKNGDHHRQRYRSHSSAHHPAKPKNNVRDRRLTEAEYRTLGEIPREAAETAKYGMTVEIIRRIALTGCRRSEMIGLKWTEADTDASCIGLEDSKEGASIRPIGLAVVEYREDRRKTATGSYVFPGQGEDNAFGGFPNHGRRIFRDSPRADVTPHVLRHSFAKDLGFTEVAIAALVGHSKGTVTSKYIRSPATISLSRAATTRASGLVVICRLVWTYGIK